MHKEKGLSDSEFEYGGKLAEFDFLNYARDVFDMAEDNAVQFTEPSWDYSNYNRLPINCAQRIVYYLINGEMPDLETPYQHLTLEDLEKCKEKI